MAILNEFASYVGGQHSALEAEVDSLVNLSETRYEADSDGQVIIAGPELVNDVVVTQEADQPNWTKYQAKAIGYEQDTDKVTINGKVQEVDVISSVYPVEIPEEHQIQDNNIVYMTNNPSATMRSLVNNGSDGYQRGVNGLNFVYMTNASRFYINENGYSANNVFPGDNFKGIRTSVDQLGNEWTQIIYGSSTASLTTFKPVTTDTNRLKFEVEGEIDSLTTDVYSN